MSSPAIVDTSALIDGADADHPGWGMTVEELLATREVLAPTLLASEAGNVVHNKHPEAFGSTPGERGEILETLLDGVDLRPGSATARTRCGELVADLDLTYYDAQFLELAERLEGLLLTQDQELLRAGKSLLGPGRCLDLDEATDLRNQEEL